MFYRAYFGMKVSGVTEREQSAISVGDGYVGMTLIPRRPGRRGGLDHFGIEVEDFDLACSRIAKDYPDIETDYAHVDAICMWMVKNPEWFDVIVTDNMFGDIITDLGAMTQGGMGLAAGGNINPKGVSMFEPIGGSAPKYTGKNIINPIAAISAAQIMLETLGEPMAASLIEESVIRVLRDDLKDVAAGKMGYSTQEVGDLVISYIKGNSKQ
jgi:3-isopropylmalate dehydrogenase